MYTIRVRHVFSAAHALVLAGTRERTHGHDWRVTAVVQAERLDADGLVCDFHALHREILRTIAPFQNANVNEVEPFDALNPSAENLARHIADALTHRLERIAPDAQARGLRVKCVRLTEAPGCEAAYFPSSAPMDASRMT